MKNHHRIVGAAMLCTACAVVFAAGDEEHLDKRTRAGREVQIRGFAEFDGECRLKHVQAITVVDAPSSGRVETRPGDVTIGGNWVGNKDCSGTVLKGVRVWYLPNPGFTGRDHFTFDVTYLSQRTVRATVDVTVEP